MIVNRKSPTALLATLQVGAPAIAEVLGLFRAELVVLDDEGRASLLRPLGEFTETAPVFVQAMNEHPRIAASVDFDGPTVLTQVEIGELADKVEAHLKEIGQLLSDVRLLQLSDAWMASLNAYRVAKAAEAHNPALRAAIDPMAAIFKARRPAASPTDLKAAALAETSAINAPTIPPAA